jgi:hypothetical protein
MEESKKYDTVLNKLADNKLFRALGAAAFAFIVYQGYEHMPARFQEESVLEEVVNEKPKNLAPPGITINPGYKPIASAINETYLNKIQSEFSDSLYVVQNGETLTSIARKYWKAEHEKNPVSKSDRESLEAVWKRMLKHRRETIGTRISTEFIYESEEIDLLP